MRLTFVIIGLFFFCLLNAQDVTGIWRGQFRSGGRTYDILNIEDKYKFEVQIEQVNKAVNGVTYSYHSTDFYAKAAAIGTVNPKSGKLIIQETRIIEAKKAASTFICAMTCYLTYSKNGDEEFLEGTYTAMNVIDSSFCGKGTVFLRRVVNSDFHKEPFLVTHEKQKEKQKQIAANTKPADPVTTKPAPKTETIAAPTKPATVKTNPPKEATTQKKPNVDVADTNKKLEAKETPTVEKNNETQKPIIVKKPDVAAVPQVLKTRDNELVKTLIVKSPEIIVQLYDNGTIDHDTVSVYLDNKLIISKQMLTTQPITFSIPMSSDNKYHELVMVAENLGEIPPNTALMVVKAGDKQYEVRIISTEQKNAMVIFKYEKPGLQ